LIKAVVFDLGNVLIDFDHTIAAKRISKFCDKTPEQIFDLFFDSEITAQFEEGKISPHDFYLKVKDMLNMRLSYDSFVPIWNEIFFLSAKNRDVYSTIERLRVNYSTTLVTNINVLHHQYLKNYFPVFDVFTSIFTSYEVGAAKPKPLIYKKILETLDILPEEAFYTDDRIDLIESARGLGFNAFVFKGTKQLNIDLRDAGINFI
jgi:putative hydrolase of the HAD superfamily